MNYPVNNLDDAYNAGHPELPLEVGDSRYLDLTAVRSSQNISVLNKRAGRKKTNAFTSNYFQVIEALENQPNCCN